MVRASDPDLDVPVARPDSVGEDVFVQSGIDVVSIARIDRLLTEFGDSFRERAFTPAERTYCEQQGMPAQHYAARWAAKEAFVKAIIDDAPPVPFRTIEIDRRADGPVLDLAGAAATALARTAQAAGSARDLVDTTVSLSHDVHADTAIGHVVLVGGGER